MLHKLRRARFFTEFWWIFYDFRKRKVLILLKKTLFPHSLQNTLNKASSARIQSAYILTRMWLFWNGCFKSSIQRNLLVRLNLCIISCIHITMQFFVKQHEHNLHFLWFLQSDSLIVLAEIIDLTYTDRDRGYPGNRHHGPHVTPLPKAFVPPL